MARKPVVRETVSLYEAKTQLSRLVDRAAEGEEIIIAKSGRPRARLVPLEDTRALRIPSRGKRQMARRAGLGRAAAGCGAPRFRRFRVNLLLDTHVLHLVG